MITLDPAFHMVVVLILTLAAMISFSLERLSLELTSILILAFLLIFFPIFPLPGESLTTNDLLAGFANPSLIAVLSLLVMGQAMVQTEALTPLAARFLAINRRRPMIGVIALLVTVLGSSAILNNTPMVVMFLPVMQAMAERLDWSPSALMMPLSFVAILGGMLTLMGSSTNLLVSSSMAALGEAPIGFFDFTVPGLVMAAVGAVYVIFVVPRILPDRRSISGALFGDGRQFIAELDIHKNSPLVGARSVAGHFKDLPNMTVRLIQRGGHNLLPPFEDITLEPGDILLVAATRQTLRDHLTRFSGYMVRPVDGTFSHHHRNPAPESESDGGEATALPTKASQRKTAAGASPAPARQGSGKEGSSEQGDMASGRERVLAEVMIAPASRMTDRSLEQIRFQDRFGVIVLGIQRRARMMRQRMGSIRLEAGDVLLVLGSAEAIERLRHERDVLLMAWSTTALPTPQRKPHAVAIFVTVFALAATGILPIAAAAFAGAVASILTGCLNIRQATRAIDRKILLIVAATLALGTALQETGGAAFVAHGLVALMGDPSPALAVSAFFLLVAASTNVLSNNACAILYAPIAINLASDLDIAVHWMAITLVLAANCSFATPIGYQTNLLVMASGNYSFRDYLRAGTPLVLLMWATFSVFFPWWAGLY